MKPIESNPLFQEVEAFEERLETIKLSVPNFSNPKHLADIVRSTAGILGRNFPSGLRYERSIRRLWQKRFQAALALLTL